MNHDLLPSANPTSSTPAIGAMLREIRAEFYGDRSLLPEPFPTGLGAVNPLLTEMSDEEAAVLYALAETILQNPEQVQQLGDHVYELLQTDLRYQRDRNGYSRR
jgi:hypothetical protein